MEERGGIGTIDSSLPDLDLHRHFFSPPANIFLSVNGGNLGRRVRLFTYSRHGPKLAWRGVAWRPEWKLIVLVPDRYTRSFWLSERLREQVATPDKRMAESCIPVDFVTRFEIEIFRGYYL